MREPTSVAALEELGRVQLSANFYMRDFLYSEIANFHGLANIPAEPDVAIEAGRELCHALLEPLQASFGRIAIRSAYRSPAVNQYGNEHGYSCASNAANFGRHIWDRRDAEGCLGATACITVPWFTARYNETGDWQKLAWWIHDQLPYSEMEFYPKLFAFNLTWREKPIRRIASYAHPKGVLTKPGMDNHAGDHGQFYGGLPSLRPAIA